MCGAAAKGAALALAKLAVGLRRFLFAEGGARLIDKVAGEAAAAADMVNLAACFGGRRRGSFS
jgi:hypothetical protein